MMIFPENKGYEPLIRSGSNIEFSTGSGSEAAFDSAFHSNPLQSLIRINDRVREETGASVVDYLNPYYLAFGEKKPLSKLMSQEEWLKSEYYRPGLKFPNGVREETAKIVAQRKDDENARKFILSRAPDTFLSHASQFGASFVASLLDPINIAASFVPAIPAARYATMIERMGIGSARVLKGVYEGIAGAALVEPLVLASARLDQADYNGLDSFLNLTFGGLLGGGLHYVGGKVADIVRGQHPVVREQALRTSIGHMAEGKSPDVGPFVKAFDDVHTHEQYNIVSKQTDRAEFLQKAKEILIGSSGRDITPAEIISKIEEIKQKNPIEYTATDRLFAKEIQNTPELQKLAEVLDKPGFQRTANDLNYIRSFKKDQARDFAAARQDEIQAKINRIDREIEKRSNTKPKTDKSKVQKETRINNLKEERATLVNELDTVKKSTPFPKTEKYQNMDQLKADVERIQKPEQDSAYNQQAVDNVNEYHNQPERELSQYVEDLDKSIQFLRDQGLLTKDQLDAYNAHNKRIQEADKVESIINDLAVCIT